MARRRYRAIVEGCVDAALAFNLLKRALGRGGSVSTDIQGGWENVIRMSVTYLVSGADAGIIAFIDADFSAREKIDSARRIASSITKYDVQAHEVFEGYRCFTLDLGSGRRLGLVLWSDKEGKGTIEDVLKNALSSVYGCGFSNHNITSCRNCPSGHRLYPSYDKLEVLCVLAACGGEGTLALSEEFRYCGLNMNKILVRLGLLDTPTLQEYVKCIKRMIQELNHPPTEHI